MTDHNDKNEIVPSAPRGLAKQGFALVRRGLDDLCKLEGGDTDAEGWISKGADLRKLGRYSEAISCFDKALELDPHNFMAWASKGSALDGLGRPHDSLRCYRRALELFPDSPESQYAWFAQGSLLEQFGRLDEALHSYDKVLELDARVCAAWVNKSAVLYRQGRYVEALESCEKAIELDPTLTHAWVGKGANLVRLRRFAEALACCERACLLDANNWSAWNYRAFAEESLGRERDAINSFDTFLSIAPREPKDQMDQAAIEYARLRLKELRKATLAASTSPNSGLRCSACGRNSSAAAKFCASCGKPLTS
jgi:tetratricopeptide (TPR) repeat protein